MMVVMSRSIRLFIVFSAVWLQQWRAVCTLGDGSFQRDCGGMILIGGEVGAGFGAEVVWKEILGQVVELVMVIVVVLDLGCMEAQWAAGWGGVRRIST